ncbi:radical SAM/SPASM domain-containing protein [Streptomyces adelaidensis]|uniref:radical SAM/SPASM domain-containing protein n=1 Tax=Streptomyces adelaidensis TaxID=2796465 RepID=UPI0027DCE98A|nr:radical SAM/SPASM domain-containing protein [Streptomyces adelaidensis]
MEAPTIEVAPAAARLLWLDLTRRCRLSCGHCYNASGPEGTHGTMSRDDWRTVLDQAMRAGVPRVQLTGGEVTTHPDAPGLVDHALALGLKVEVYSNLVHITKEWWGLLQRDGVTLATSYYSDHSAEHNSMTRRPSHARTRENIEKAVQLGIPLRVGLIVGDDAQRAAEAEQELHALGVTNVRRDRVRPFGRGAHGQAPDMGGLCGRCGTDRAAIGPDGDVSPCVFSTAWPVGNVQAAPLADILGGAAMASAQTSIRNARTPGFDGCTPDTDDECTPGTPGSECTPRN